MYRSMDPRVRFCMAASCLVIGVSRIGYRGC